MREILFRAKSEFDKNKKWVYGDLIQGENSYISTKEEFYSAVVSLGGNLATRVELVDKGTICEYTGLKDKNGNKIFEGDIVKLAEPKLKIEWFAVVEFGNPNGVYDWGYQLKPMTNNAIKYNYNLDILCWVGMEDVNVYCEVIGNIYDNPELVKGENLYD